MLQIICILSLCFNFIYAGTISGTVSYAGKNKAPKTLKMDSDPICGASHEVPPAKEDWILDKNNNFKDVIVWIKNITYEGDLSNNAITIDQKGCIYTPHVNVVTTGQKVLIKNSDQTLHNVNSQSKANPTFNSAQPAGVPDIEKVFTASEDPFYVKCDVHPWMKAWIMVADHPYFAITNSDGSYTIENVPAGTYEVGFWQEKLSNLPAKKFNLPSNTIQVTVTEEGVAEGSFVFDSPANYKK